MATQLALVELAREKSALVEQPGEDMHQPRGGSQPLDRQRDPRVVAGAVG